MNDRNYVVPQDPIVRDMLLAVDRKTKADISSRFGYNVSNDWECNTIAYSTLETIITQLGFETVSDGIGKGFIFKDILLAKVTIKVDEDAEKEGNINIFFEPYTRVNEIIAENGVDPEYEKEDGTLLFINPDEPLDGDDDYTKIDSFTRYNLSNIYSIIIPSKPKYVALAIAYQFYENLFREMLREFRSEDNNGELVSVNFNDLVEIHCQEDKDGSPKITIRPGVLAKLAVKSDKTTENEELE